MQPSRPSIWLPESNRIASGKPGTLQTVEHQYMVGHDHLPCIAIEVAAVRFNVNLRGGLESHAAPLLKFSRSLASTVATAPPGGASDS